jgi:glutamate--cysteine ligase
MLDYFEAGAVPRERWQVGMELEKMGRHARTGRPLPYEAAPGAPSVLRVLQMLHERLGGDPVFEADYLVGLDGERGTVSLEPGGQVEWSSRPERDLGALAAALDHYLETAAAVGHDLGVRWLDVGVDPEWPIEDMPWMPKARYAIMRDYFRNTGRLAHRMMTQTTSVQCAFDYEDHVDWKRKFRAASLLSPIAAALFANSPRADGHDTGFRSFRVEIWRHTDPARCGLPAVVFDPAFDVEMWLDWVLDVPSMFHHRARGLVPSGGVPFRKLLARTGCEALKPQDWETHLSTIFTEVRSYTYIEVRSADLQPDELVLAVPAFWTGILYSADGIEAAFELGRPFDDATRWSDAMLEAARHGVEDGSPLREPALRTVDASLRNLRAGPWASPVAAAAIERLAARHRLPIA